MQTDSILVPANGNAEAYIPEAIYFLLIDTGTADQVDVETHRQGGHRELAADMPAGYQVKVANPEQQARRLVRAKFFNNTASAITVKYGYSVDLAEIDKLNIDVQGAIKLGGNPVVSDQVVSVSTSTTGAQVAANTDRGQGASLQNHGPNVCWIRYGSDPVPGTFTGIAVGVGQTLAITSTAAIHMITATGTAEVYVNEEQVA